MTRLLEFIRLRARPTQTVLITLLLAAIGSDLVAQSNRYALTPAYGVLLNIVSAQAWGYAYLAGAVGLLFYMMAARYRSVSVAAHTFVVILLGIWLFAFVVRWSTDSATTIVNVCSWATFLILAVWSATLTAHDELRRAPFGPGGPH